MVSEWIIPGTTFSEIEKEVHKMKKVSLILALTLIIGCMDFGSSGSVCAASKTEIASVEFGSGLRVEEDIELSGGTISDSESATGFDIGKLDGDAVYIDITDESISTKTDGSKYEVEIEYYDDTEGYFVLWYDAIDYGQQIAVEETDGQVVYKRGDKCLKTSTFILEDAAFNGGISGSDLMISLKEMGIALGSLQSPLYVQSIKIFEIPSDVKIIVDAKTEALGNTFGYKEGKIVTNKFTNPTDEDKNLNVRYELKDAAGKIYFSAKESFSVAANSSQEREININSENCGVYNWYITVTDGDYTRTYKEDTIVIIKTDPDGIKGNFGWIHEGVEKYTEDEAGNAISLMKKGNVAGLRLEVKWKDVETGTKGNYSLTGTKFKQNIDLCEKLGLPYYVLVYGGNTLYQDTAGIPDEDDEAACEGWRGFCNYLFNELKDTNVIMYEIWNEPDLAAYNPTSATAEDLAEITRIARTELDEVNAETGKAVKISGFSVTGLTDLYSGRLKNWIRPGIEAGIADKDAGMNVLSVHTYAPDREPEKAEIYDVIKQYQKEIGESENGTQNIPVLISEFGNSTLPESSHGKILPETIGTLTTEEDKRNWITRAAILYKANGVGDYTTAHALAKKGIFTADREDQFGMTSPIYDKYNIEGVTGIPTESYLAYAAMNYVLGGNITSYEPIFEGNIYANKFESDKFDKTILTLWAAYEDEAVSVDLGVNEITAFDMLGNEKKLYSSSGVYTFDLDGSVTYVMGDFDTVTITDAVEGFEDAFDVYTSSTDLEYPGLWEAGVDKYAGESPVGDPVVKSYNAGEPYGSVLHLGLKSDTSGSVYAFNELERRSQLGIYDTSRKVVLSADVYMIGIDTANKDRLQLEVFSDEYVVDIGDRQPRLGFGVFKDGTAYKLMSWGGNDYSESISSVTLSKEIWYNIKLEYDPETREVNYYLNDELQYTGEDLQPDDSEPNSFGNIRIAARTSDLTGEGGYYIDNVKFYVEDSPTIKFADMYGNTAEYQGDNQIPVGTKQIIIPDASQNVTFTKQDGTAVDSTQESNVLSLNDLLVSGNYTLTIGTTVYDLTVTGTGRFMINGVKFKNGTVVCESVPVSGTSLKAVVELENSTADEKSGKVIIAEYGDNDILLNAFVRDIDMYSGRWEDEEYSFTVSVGCKQIKGFIWSDLEKLIPMIDFAELN